MVRVKKSNCHCGKCGNDFAVEWELDAVNFSEGSMGERVYYTSEMECDCPVCGNVIHGELSVSEYPAGTMEGLPEIRVEDSEETYASAMEKPIIMFFDL